MVRIPTNDSDDLQFIDLAERVINAEALLVSAEMLHLARIDSWFGDGWYAFNSKQLGAFGVHSFRKLRVPPFHPHRVVSESRFRLADPPVPIAFSAPLHTLHSSGSNDRHFFAGRLRRQGCGAWYSGDSGSSGRGSIMVYSSTPNGTVGWYAGLERREEWQPTRLVGIGHRNWSTLLERQSAAR